MKGVKLWKFLWFLILLTALAGASLHQRWERGRWPDSHPRHHRAHMLYLATASFWLLALASVLLGKDDLGAVVFGLGFVVWFVVFRKRIPTEADVLAYEAQYTPPEPATQPRGYSPPPIDTGSQTPLLDPPLPRGSMDWAMGKLGTRAGASLKDITRAYHRLIQDAHPDHGGDTERAADLNLARQILLGK